MLNISNNQIDRDSINEKYSSFRAVEGTGAARKIVLFLSVSFLFGLALLFFPWTQNIKSKGKLTTLRPEDREQTIHSMIAGRIEKWYVQEGDLVAAGDTIVFISEVKENYLDPELIAKTREQSRAKTGSADAYSDKANALATQVEMLKRTKKLKTEQAKNYLEQAGWKVISDSIEFETALINQDIAQKQYDRQQTLYEQGLKSLTDLEQRKQKLQESINKRISAANKWLASKNEFLNAQLSIDNLENEYTEKIAKAESDRQSALSSGFEAQGEISKLSIQQESYQRRSQFYCIKAPQDGYITKALIMGIGEAVKEGQAVFSFIPSHYDLVAELYVNPIDLPLIHEGNKVQLQFDGWPALVFSGWPGLSVGSYTGKVVAFDKAAGANGQFRILVAPDPESEPWPNMLRLGTGAYGIAMLKNVSVWYELWRNLNGFPPDFYMTEGEVKESVEKKK